MTAGGEPEAAEELAGTLAVVTGGGNGIGRATAELLAQRGAQVLVVDRDRPAAEAAVAGIEAQGGRASLSISDVSRADDVTRVAEVAGERGGAGILVNAVGIQRYGDALETDEATWDEVMAVNVKSMFLMSKALLPRLIEHRGSIVNLGSVQSLGAFRGAVAYVTSKGAVANLTKALAADFAPEVRVNAVLPGSVDTPMLRNSAAELAPDDPDGALDEWGSLHPLQRIATPAEVAEMVCFLAGPKASFSTGGLFTVDGGMTAVIR